MLTKPVEVWCIEDASETVYAISLSPFTGVPPIHLPAGDTFHKRRLLVKEGQTWQDGVEVAINHLALSGVIKIDGVFAKELRAISEQEGTRMKDYNDPLIQIEVLKEYMQVMIALKGWHWVSDAANDLRVIEVRLK